MVNARTIPAAAGFTLMEVLVALSILGLAMFILLQSHYGAMSLFDDTVTEVDARMLLEEAAEKAELAVLQGELGAGDEFGAPFEEYSWASEAVHTGAFEEIQLYEINVYVTGPDLEENLMFYSYLTGPVESMTQNRL